MGALEHNLFHDKVPYAFVMQRESLVLGVLPYEKENTKNRVFVGKYIENYIEGWYAGQAAGGGAPQHGRFICGVYKFHEGYNKVIFRYNHMPDIHKVIHVYDFKKILRSNKEPKITVTGHGTDKTGDFELIDGQIMLKSTDIATNSIPMTITKRYIN